MKNGSNTLKADRLFDVAQALRVEPAYFFDELNVRAAKPDLIRKHQREYLRRKETRRLLRLFETIEGSEVRKRILNLVRAVAKSDSIKTSRDGVNS